MEWGAPSYLAARFFDADPGFYMTDGQIQALATLVAAAFAIGGIILQMRWTSAQSIALARTQLELEEKWRDRKALAARRKLTSLASEELSHNAKAAQSVLLSIEEIRSSTFPYNSNVVGIMNSLVERLDIESTWSINNDVETLASGQILALTNYWIAAKVAKRSADNLAKLLTANEALAKSILGQLNQDFEQLVAACQAAQASFKLDDLF